MKHFIILFHQYNKRLDKSHSKIIQNTYYFNSPPDNNTDYELENELKFHKEKMNNLKTKIVYYI